MTWPAVWENDNLAEAIVSRWKKPIFPNGLVGLMNPGGRVTIKVGGTIWSRFLVAVAVMRVFWLQFVLAILAWMVAGVVLHETPLLREN